MAAHPVIDASADPRVRQVGRLGTQRHRRFLGRGVSEDFSGQKVLQRGSKIFGQDSGGAISLDGDGPLPQIS